MQDIELSIIIPCYNHAMWLAPCLDSVCSQNIEASFEVIVVNDCSTDNFQQVAENLKKKYPALKVIENTENVGAAMSRNHGVRNSSGRIIFFLDADDELLPGEMARAWDAVAAGQNDLDVFIFGLLAVDKAGNENYKALPPLSSNKEKNLQDYLQGKLRFGQGSYFIKRESFLKYPFEESMRIDEDAYLFCQMLINCRAQTFDFPIVKYQTELGHVRKDLKKRFEQGFYVEDLFFSTEAGKNASKKTIELAYFKRCNSLMKKALQNQLPAKACDFYLTAIKKIPSLKFNKKLLRKYLKATFYKLLP